MRESLRVVVDNLGEYLSPRAPGTATCRTPEARGTTGGHISSRGVMRGHPPSRQYANLTCCVVCVCLGRGGTYRDPADLAPGDFESRASASFATSALFDYQEFTSFPAGSAIPREAHWEAHSKPERVGHLPAAHLLLTPTCPRPPASPILSASGWISPRPSLAT